jgi:hypothetical protein
MHEQLLPKHKLGLGYELEGRICLKLVELLFIYLHISAICFQNLLNINLLISVVEAFLPHIFTQVS